MDGLCKLLLAVVPQAALECRKYLVTIAVPHRQTKGKPNFFR
jgi:hypothetical protein